ncbi:MAG: hypothetical protein IC227_00355 [Enterococcus lacertideformus]|uniref:Uncharacterized protein n=1 Tax=Enterococcus lacertideformus TaxID=2771493 RepID=A0A931AXF8_9ENTE|nr:hypothetical protein [Enterococcus lacertideformus]
MSDNLLKINMENSQEKTQEENSHKLPTKKDLMSSYKKLQKYDKKKAWKKVNEETQKLMKDVSDVLEINTKILAQHYDCDKVTDNSTLKKMKIENFTQYLPAFKVIDGNRYEHIYETIDEVRNSAKQNEVGSKDVVEAVNGHINLDHSNKTDKHYNEMNKNTFLGKSDFANVNNEDTRSISSRDSGFHSNLDDEVLYEDLNGQRSEHTDIIRGKEKNGNKINEVKKTTQRTFTQLHEMALNKVNKQYSDQSVHTNHKKSEQQKSSIKVH